MALVGVGSEVGLAGYRVQWVAAVVALPACRTLTCWLVAGAEMGGAGHRMCSRT